MNEDFEIIGSIEQIETIAVGNGIREIRRLHKGVRTRTLAEAERKGDGKA